MIKERYVSFEVAKLLRDKGFNEKCFKIYNINNGLIFINYERSKRNYYKRVHCNKVSVI